MKRLYSQSTQTTYLLGIHTEIPSDTVEMSEALFLSVIGNPAPGKVRAHDERGLPYLVDASDLTPDLVPQERAWRDVELSAVMWLRERHRDQLEIAGPTTLSSDQFDGLLMYMQALRDWPQSADFPDSQYRPVAPLWIAEQTQ
ncbi:phage tail assembly chaperone [Pseudomonas hormoni]